MPLNGVEKYQQEKFKRKQYARPTPEQLEIARLEQQLEHAQNTIQYLNGHIDKLVDQRDRVNGHIALYESHERSAGITLDNIRAVLR